MDPDLGSIGLLYHMYRDALCTEQLSTYLNDSDCIVSWAGCVQHAEGFGVSLSLGCATFPFLALLTCVSRGVNVVEKITGELVIHIGRDWLFTVANVLIILCCVKQRTCLQTRSSGSWRPPWTATTRSWPRRATCASNGTFVGHIAGILVRVGLTLTGPRLNMQHGNPNPARTAGPRVSGVARG